MDVKTALVSIAGAAMFCTGAGVTACVMAPGRKPPPVFAQAKSDDPNLVVEYAREHPDPAISGAFADKLESGEIKIVLEEPKEHAMASFGERGGGYVLTFDPARVKPEPTRDDLEDVLSILSHEHAHYRQFVEGEMANYYPRGGRMSEAQCTLTMLVEIDAHGKACRDAKAYGWTSYVATSSCGRTMASLAEYFLRERAAAYPDCKAVWEFYAAHDAGAKAPAAKKRAPNPPRQRSGPIYLPPP